MIASAVRVHALEVNLDLPAAERLRTPVKRAAEVHQPPQARHGRHLPLHQGGRLLVVRVEVLQPVRRFHHFPVDFHHSHGKGHLLLLRDVGMSEYGIRLADSQYPYGFGIMHRCPQCLLSHVRRTVIQIVRTADKTKHAAPEQHDGGEYYPNLHPRSHIFTI